MSSDWTNEDSSDLFNLDRWGSGYFKINADGELVVQVDDEHQISILEGVRQANDAGFHAPFLVRFPHLIERRLQQINTAFDDAILQFKYRGNYRCFYPTKVNQHRDVVVSAIQFGKQFGGGVEAGSKAELFALLLLCDNTVPILCNGFKDRSIVEMAFRGMQLGRDITIIIEKPSELKLIIEMAKRLQLKPKLGVRIKLAARSGGRWNASAGSKSKFGLNVSQLIQVVEELRQEQLLDCLYLLHFHPGSQISNVRKIKASIVEAARVYADLVKNGVPLTAIDVGGGLAVDYTGERSQDPSSKNYSLIEYANDVVYYIQQVCVDANVSFPDIISESGRAITAHHSILVIPILENPGADLQMSSADLHEIENSSLLGELKLILESLSPGNLSEAYHDAQASIETVWQMFSLGTISLEQRSCAERLVELICKRVSQMLGQLEFVPSELVELRNRLADTYIANFSLFQAIPDSWALNQVFPVAPIHRLNEKPTRRAVIGDITCDSDGKIDCFIGSKGGKNSLPLHELNGQNYYVGVFLIGAYQEALSDDHNLMGNFHILTLQQDHSFNVQVGASTIDVLVHVSHQRQELLDALDNSIENAELDSDDESQIRSIFDSVMNSYTYLDPSESVSDATESYRNVHSAEERVLPKALNRSNRVVSGPQT